MAVVRTIITSRIATMPGQSTSGFHKPRRLNFAPSAKRREVRRGENANVFVPSVGSIQILENIKASNRHNTTLLCISVGVGEREAGGDPGRVLLEYSNTRTVKTTQVEYSNTKCPNTRHTK